MSLEKNVDIKIDEQPAKNIRTAVYRLLVKLLGSRKSFWNFVNTFVAWTLMISFSTQKIPLDQASNVLITYGISQFITALYLGLVELEKIKVEASIKH